jgi:hypothetical protein
LVVLGLVTTALLEAGALEAFALEAAGVEAGPRETGVEADGVPVVTAVTASAACAVPRASSLPLAPRSATPSRKLTSKPKVFVFIVVCLLPDTAPDPLTFREETMCNWLAKSLVSCRSPAAEAKPPDSHRSTATPPRNCRLRGILRHRRPYGRVGAPVIFPAVCPGSVRILSGSTPNRPTSAAHGRALMASRHRTCALTVKSRHRCQWPLRVTPRLSLRRPRRAKDLA